MYLFRCGGTKTTNNIYLLVIFNPWDISEATDMWNPTTDTQTWCRTSAGVSVHTMDLLGINTLCFLKP